MRVSKIEIKNFRLLKNFEISLENNFSLIVGKNNTGKTSFLTVLSNFLNKNKFCYNDLNIDLQTYIRKIVEGEETCEQNSEIGISMKLYITYDDNDNISNISNLILDLEPNNKEIIIEFLYCIDKDIIDRIKSDFKTAKDNCINFETFIQKMYKNYFVLKRRVLDKNNKENSKDIDDIRILSDIINLEYISAKREVSNNEDNKNAETLSKKAEKYYNLISNNGSETGISELQKSIFETDEKLTENYKALFEDIINAIAQIGGINSNDAKLKVKSNLQDKNLLSSNTLIKYDCNDDGELPENYNGLGYLNFISMIFDIYLILESFKRKNKKENPADINILFIEEPEAHTHPQMQYIFIRKIKKFLSDNEEELNLQTIITTHSSHIIAEDDFLNIKYFLNKGKNEVISKSLKDYFGNIRSKDGDFLKKYLTVDRTELFFADKSILIEGNTERLLMPIFMKIIDNKQSDNDHLPLLSQNISIISVGGSHAHIFIDFLNFLEIKTLIITDLDPGKKEKGSCHVKKCKTSEAEISTNSTIEKFLGCYDIKKIQENKEKTFKYISEDKIYTPDKNGKIYIAYQTEQNGYTAASFEDAFISINLPWIKSNKGDFKSLPSKKLETESFYNIAQSLNNKKIDFALDIIYNIDNDFDKVKIPEYIEEGLQWLKK